MRKFFLKLIFALSLLFPVVAQAQISEQERLYLQRNYPEGVSQLESTNRTRAIREGDVLFRSGAYTFTVKKFQPAPGQFTNTGIGDPIAPGTAYNGEMVSLGGFGGYIDLEASQSIPNHPLNPYGVDFTIKGNAFYAASGGSAWSEPGAVMVCVSEDDYKKGIWYELAGSAFHLNNKGGYGSITYSNPNYDKRFPVMWTHIEGGDTIKGGMATNAFHKQPYHPDPVLFEDSSLWTGITFDKVRFEPLLVDMSQQNYIVVRRSPAFGYADNWPNTPDPTNPVNPYHKEGNNSKGNGFDISWAVDSLGNPVQLESIKYIRIYNSTQYNAGWLGEISTEVTGIGVTDPQYHLAEVPAPIPLRVLNVPQLQMAVGQTMPINGIHFNNGIPDSQATANCSFWIENETGNSTDLLAKINNGNELEAVNPGEIYLFFGDPNSSSSLDKDSILIELVNVLSVALELEGNTGSNFTSFEMYKGDSQFLTAYSIDDRGSQIGPTPGSNKRNHFVYDSYTWSVANPAVVKVTDGHVEALATGNTTITVTSAWASAPTATVSVTVLPIPALTPTSKILFDGQSTEFEMASIFSRQDEASIRLLSAEALSGANFTASVNHKKNRLVLSLNEGAAPFQSNMGSVKLRVRYHHEDLEFTIPVGWKFVTLTIDPNIQNGSVAVSQDGQTLQSGDSVPAGSFVRVQATPQAGYRVKSITVGSTTIGANDYNARAPKTDFTVSAEFTQDPIKLHITQPEHGTIQVFRNDVELSDGATLNVGDELHVVVTPDSAYHASEIGVNVYGECLANQDQSVPATYDYVITQDKNFDVYVYAKILRNMYTIIYRSDAHGSILGDTLQVVPHGSYTTVVSVLDDDGYLFVGWDDGGLDTMRCDQAFRSMTVTAQHIQDVLLLEYHAGKHGTLVTESGSSQSTVLLVVPRGQDGDTIKAESKSYWYEFECWSDGVISAARKELNVQDSINVTAYFKHKWLASIPECRKFKNRKLRSDGTESATPTPEVQPVKEPLPIDPLAAVEVAPNPFAQTLRLANAAAVVRVSLFDIQGRKVLEQLNAGQPELQLNTEELAAGPYLLVLFDAQGNKCGVQLVK